MQINIREDNRTLREFYPNPNLRHQVHYAFGHQFLPHYVHQCASAFFYRLLAGWDQDTTHPIRFIQANWNLFEESQRLVAIEQDPFKEGMLFRRVSDLSMSIREVAGRPVALVSMPPPERPPEAYYIAAVLLASAARPATWTKDPQVRIFTLEATHAAPAQPARFGVVGEWTKGGEHLNHGFDVPPDCDAFCEAIEGLLRGPQEPAACG